MQATAAGVRADSSAACVDFQCCEGNRQDDGRTEGWEEGPEGHRGVLSCDRSQGRNRCLCVSVHLCTADTLRDTWTETIAVILGGRETGSDLE